MWQVKTFKTQSAMRRWIATNESKYQWQEVFINNGYGVEYRPLRRIY